MTAEKPDEPTGDAPDEPKGDQPGKPEHVDAGKDERTGETSEPGSDPPRPAMPSSDTPDEVSSRSEPEAFEATQIKPGEARVPEIDKERILGSRYERQSFEATTKAPSMMGNNNTQNVFEAAKRTISFRRPPGIDDLASSYEPTTQDNELRRLLDRRTTVCLSGEPGTGRFTTACCALLACPGIEQIMELRPPPGQTPEEAVHDINEVDPKYGYVLRINGDDPAPIIGRLDGIVRASDSKLLLIRDVTNRAPEQGDAELRHVPPSPSGVFRVHVHRLQKWAHGEPADYIRMLDSGLLLPPNPRDVVALVKVALQQPPNDANRERLNQRSRRVSRSVAGEILEVRCADGPPGRRRLNATNLSTSGRQPPGDDLRSGW